MPASVTTKSLPPPLPVEHRVSSTPASATMKRPGSRAAEAGFGDAWASRRRRRPGRPSASRRRRAPPVRRQCRGTRDVPCAAQAGTPSSIAAAQSLALRIDVGDLRPEVHVEARSDTFERERQLAPQQPHRRRDAELLAPSAASDVGVWRLDGHFRVHPDRDRRHDAARARHRSSRRSSALRLSTFIMSTPASSACSSSRTVFPTPLNTMSAPAKPAAGAKHSPPDTMSTPAPSSLSSAGRRGSSWPSRDSARDAAQARACAASALVRVANGVGAVHVAGVPAAAAMASSGTPSHEQPAVRGAKPVRQYACAHMSLMLRRPSRTMHSPAPRRPELRVGHARGSSPWSPP